MLSRYGHILDNGEWGYLSTVFALDATLDAQYVTAHGLGEIEQFLQPFDRWTSHHTLNTATRYVGSSGDVSAWSRFLLVEASGRTASGDYVDLLRQDRGRLAHPVPADPPTQSAG